VYYTLASRLYTDRIEKGDTKEFLRKFNKPILPALFDWLLVPYNKKDVQIDILYGNVAIPRTIYVKTDSLRVFARQILPNLTHPFVLYTGSNDFTIPKNLDLRFNATEYNERFQPAWNRITKHRLLLRWYAENHDENHPKVSTMPIGLNPKEFHPDERIDFVAESNIPRLEDRPMKILSIDRTRIGPQWEDRRDAHTHCANAGEVCVAVDAALTHTEFAHLISSYPFLLCVHGGGIGIYFDTLCIV